MPSLCQLAAREGRIDVLHWLQQHGQPLDEWTCRAAATSGQLETLQWARSQGAPISELTCFYTVLEGQLPMLQWLYEHTPPEYWNESEVNAAAFRGHLHILIWLCSLGLPWSEQTCANAAASGSVETLAWLRLQTRHVRGT